MPLTHAANAVHRSNLILNKSALESGQFVRPFFQTAKIPSLDCQHFFLPCFPQIILPTVLPLLRMPSRICPLATAAFLRVWRASEAPLLSASVVGPGELLVPWILPCVYMLCCQEGLRLDSISFGRPGLKG